jgi:MoaA/NifB/PqqE/SkfB family radical SAM enzyme
MNLTASDHPELKETGNQQSKFYKKIKPPVVNGLHRVWVAIRVRTTILMIALKCYGSLFTAFKALRLMIMLKDTIGGKKQLRRCISLNGKYYFGIYIPAFPSQVFNRYVQTELNHLLPHKKPVNFLQVIQMAITTRCPLKCEHCFEWKNLNQPETFSQDELQMMIRKFQQTGCAQFHLSGGEPLVNIDRLTTLVTTSERSSEFYVLTSGLNLTAFNAKKLKESGITGVIISIDHYDPAMHDIFRGSDHAFSNAINAVHHARQAGLLTALSICVTRSFASQENLYKYANLARNCGVAFVQVLEPKPVGHYENKAVTLTKEHTDILDEFYLTINYSKKYRDYPVFLYHGFHQRKIGCFSGGDKLIYIDAAGYIDACPFCQTKNYHAKDIISGELPVSNLKIGGCPAYNKETEQKSLYPA